MRGEHPPDASEIQHRPEPPASREVLVLAADIGILERSHEASLLDLIPKEQALSIRRNRLSLDRQRRILARLLLAFGLGLLDGWDLRTGLDSLRHEPQGRPWIFGSSRPVSISHAGRWAVGGIGPARAANGIGVDAEEIRPMQAEDFRLVFSAREREEIRQAAVPASELIRRWTIKEAVLKAAGTGLLDDPLRIDTSGNGVSNGIRWRHLPLSEGYWLTVAGLPHGVPARLVTPSRDRLLASLEATAPGAAPGPA